MGFTCRLACYTRIGAIQLMRIDDYVMMPRSARTAHADLSSPCLLGPKNLPGMQLRWRLLNKYLNLPDEFKGSNQIHCCHLCRNDTGAGWAVCNNPEHLYWGTAAENNQDNIDKLPEPRIIEKTEVKYIYKDRKPYEYQSEDSRQSAMANLAKLNQAKWIDLTDGCIANKGNIYARNKNHLKLPLDAATLDSQVIMLGLAMTGFDTDPRYVPKSQMTDE